MDYCKKFWTSQISCSNLLNSKILFFYESKAVTWIKQKDFTSEGTKMPKTTDLVEILGFVFFGMTDKWENLSKGWRIFLSKGIPTLGGVLTGWLNYRLAGRLPPNRCPRFQPLSTLRLRSGSEAAQVLLAAVPYGTQFKLKPNYSRSVGIVFEISNSR